MAQTLTIKGERFFLLDENEYRKLGGIELPALPPRDAQGNGSALDYARASLARKIITQLQTAGMSQADLARRAGVRAETINRILKGKVTPDRTTLGKIDRALELWRLCLESGNWPAYPTQSHYATLPAWEEARWLAREEEEAA